MRGKYHFSSTISGEKHSKHSKILLFPILKEKPKIITLIYGVSVAPVAQEITSLSLKARYEVSFYLVYLNKGKRELDDSSYGDMQIGEIGKIPWCSEFRSMSGLSI